MLGAKAAYNEQLQLLENLQKQAPDNMTVLRSYMAALLDVGDTHMHFKEYDSAEKTLTRATEIAEALRKLNITNATALRDLVVVHVKLAILSAQLGRHGTAVSRYRKCIELIDEGLRLAPGDRRLQLDKAGFLWNMASELAELDKASDAHACLQESYKLHRELAKNGPLPSPQDQIYSMLQKMFGQ
jgi:tetratricopeptide (TPR) repeat protein